MPPQYFLLKWEGPKLTSVIWNDHNTQKLEVLFCGGRWEARRMLKQYRSQPAYENIPAFCVKKARNGNPAPWVEIPLGK